MTAILNVPYKDKDKAKELGAKWNPDLKKWMAPHDEPELIRLWGEEPKNREHQASKPQPTHERHKSKSVQLISEDRSFQSDLCVDIPPRNAIFEIRKALSGDEWHALRDFVMSRASACEICSVKPGSPLEVHERWLYDDKNNIRVLKRLIAICADCHEVTHFNLTYGKRREENAIDHFRKVTGLDRIRVEEHIEDAYASWKDRNDFKWSDDLSMIKFL